MADIAAWNTANPIGTRVLFWPAFKDEPGRESVTRSAAWVLSSGAAVVLVDGYAGGIALTHVEPVQAGAQ
ncbi:hypothetical protein [Kribbella deserti]|uniref:Uncharacterized protein n=1 Tax=Kribbella deserti TaxID=1926257 RepID=A0ABV6QND0_9ACTN